METLITDRLILREWKETDNNDLYEYAKTDLVGPNAGWQPHKDEEESKKIIQMFIKNNDSYAVVLKEENKVIGGIGIHDRKPDESLSYLKQREIGYVLNPKYWGKGIIPEAVKCLIKYGFENLNLDLIWCAHFDYNLKSKRVIEKCGFKYRFKKDEKLKLLDNKEVTILYYSIFRNVYLNNKSQEDILSYYKNELKWNPPFAETLSKYSNDALKGYLIMRESVENGGLPKKTRELIFTILDSLDDEVSGAKAHAVRAIEAGLTMEELVEAFVIVTIVKGINVLCKAGNEAIKAAEKKAEEMKLEK